MEYLTKRPLVPLIAILLVVLTPTGLYSQVNHRGSSTAVVFRPPGADSPRLLQSPYDTCEIAFDDGVWDKAYYYFNEDDVMAEEFVTGMACDWDSFYIDDITVRLLNSGDYPPYGWPDPHSDAFRVGVWVDVSGDGIPDEPPISLDTVLATAGDPSAVAIRPYPPVVLGSGQHFWVGITNLDGGGQEALCLDAQTDYPEHKWGREGGVWSRQDYYSGDHMIRVFMGGNRHPKLTGPSSLNGEEGSFLQFEVTVDDPDGEEVLLVPENLPAGAACFVEDSRAVFEWVPGFCQGGTHVVKFVATDVGRPALSDTLEVSLEIGEVNRPPTVSVEPSPKMGYVGETATIHVSLYDPDWLECHDDTVYLTGSGPGVVTDSGNGHALYTWVPSEDDTGRSTVSFSVVDEAGVTDSVECEILIVQHRLELGIMRVYGYPGQQHVAIPVLLSNPTDSIGAFEILMEYDITAFRIWQVTTPESIYVSPFSPDSGWYYAPTRYPPEYYEVSVAPGGYPNRVQVIGIMNMAWPTEITPPIQPGLEQLLFCLVGDISALWDGHISLVGFRTLGCGGNALASPDGYTVWGPSTEFVPPQVCPDRPDSLRVIALQGGMLGIYEILVGDLNLNGIQYEVGDAIIFINYYMEGRRALVAPEIQGPASDVNGDGIWWTIGDLVMLLNYVHEPPLASPPADDDESVEVCVAETGEKELAFTVRCGVPLGGAFINMKYDTSVVGIEAIEIAGSCSNMTLRSSVRRDEVRVLIYSMEGQSVPAGESPLFTVRYRLIAPLPDGDLGEHIRLHETSFADFRGRELTAVLTEIDFEPLGDGFSLQPHSQNPFRHEMEIAFTIPRKDQVSLMIYDSSGRLVKELFKGLADKGTHHVTWEGLDRFGRPLPSGVYFCAMDAEGFHQVKKLTILR